MVNNNQSGNSINAGRDVKMNHTKKTNINIGKGKLIVIIPVIVVFMAIAGIWLSRQTPQEQIVGTWVDGSVSFVFDENGKYHSSLAYYGDGTYVINDEYLLLSPYDMSAEKISYILDGDRLEFYFKGELGGELTRFK